MGINEIYFQIADTSVAEEISKLVNSAYRGESSKMGWTTEADLLGGQRTDSDQIREMILKTHSVLILAASADKILGCVHLECRPNDCYLGMLTVEPQYQRVGLGKKLMAAAEEYAANKWGSAEIKISVISQRIELINWYEKRGYVRTGKYEPFPYGNSKFGLPKRDDLKFEILSKAL